MSTTPLTQMPRDLAPAPTDGEENAGEPPSGCEAGDQTQGGEDQAVHGSGGLFRHRYDGRTGLADKLRPNAMPIRGTNPPSSDSIDPLDIRAKSGLGQPIAVDPKGYCLGGNVQRAGKVRLCPSDCEHIGGPVHPESLQMYTLKSQQMWSHGATSVDSVA